MNIFAVDADPKVAAQDLVDSHVVKMILESAQLLSTAHRVLDGVPYFVGKTKKWKLPDDRDSVLYSATHVNHPSAVWVRQCTGNYKWLVLHYRALLAEYTNRYGKHHKCEALIVPLSTYPDNLPIGDRQPFAIAMDKMYIISEDAVENYRNYYRNGKTHLHKWTKRNPPTWVNQ